MATLPTASYNKSTDKVNDTHLEEVKDPESADHDQAVGDYSGFTQKTDPVEIKLVRKLDRYIMVGGL